MHINCNNKKFPQLEIFGFQPEIELGVEIGDSRPIYKNNNFLSHHTAWPTLGSILTVSRDKNFIVHLNTPLTIQQI
jgi:hypothetical protein